MSRFRFTIKFLMGTVLYSAGACYLYRVFGRQVLVTLPTGLLIALAIEVISRWRRRRSYRAGIGTPSPPGTTKPK